MENDKLNMEIRNRDFSDALHMYRFLKDWSDRIANACKNNIALTKRMVDVSEIRAAWNTLPDGPVEISGKIETGGNETPVRLSFVKEPGAELFKSDFISVTLSADTGPDIDEMSFDVDWVESE